MNSKFVPLFILSQIICFHSFGAPGGEQEQKNDAQSILNGLGQFSVREHPDASCSGALPHSSKGPVGQLAKQDMYAGGSTDGQWFKDENGTLWFVKKDVHYPELQTSAEVISSEIYSHFGYNVPETVKFAKDGVFCSASKNVGLETRATDFSEMNTSEIRQLRVVAAYLKDWDRLGNPDNNKKARDGTLTLLDFGGTLGSRAQGQHKPGKVFSQAIGSFEATSDVGVIYDQFGVNASKSHPWNQLTRTDVEKVIEKFKGLTDDKLTKIVKDAHYSDSKDESYMLNALKLRRDGIVSSLLSRFPEQK